LRCSRRVKLRITFSYCVAFYCVVMLYLLTRKRIDPFYVKDAARLSAGEGCT
jgi:hypothetical protein